MLSQFAAPKVFDIPGQDEGIGIRKRQLGLNAREDDVPIFGVAVLQSRQRMR